MSWKCIYKYSRRRRRHKQCKSKARLKCPYKFDLSMRRIFIHICMKTFPYLAIENLLLQLHLYYLHEYECVCSMKLNKAYVWYTYMTIAMDCNDTVVVCRTTDSDTNLLSTLYTMDGTKYNVIRYSTLSICTVTISVSGSGVEFCVITCSKLNTLFSIRNKCTFVY